MATTNDTLLIRKTKLNGTVGNVTSTLGTWNIACVSFPFETGEKTKNLYVNEWEDEHGDDAFIPDELLMEAYDVDASFAYKGSLSTAYTKLKQFKRFLSGADGYGASLEIYHPQTGIGRRKCYLKEFSDKDFVRSNIDDVLTFTVTFRVTDPVTDITLSV